MTKREILTLKRKPADPVPVEPAPAETIAPSEAIPVPDTKPPRGREIIALLAEAYPQTFFAGKHRKPLAAGIHQQILDAMPHIGRKRLKQAMRSYCNGAGYFRAFATETHRVDLAGQPVTEVLPEDRLYAEKQLRELEEFKKKAKQEKKAKAKTGGGVTNGA